METIIVHGGAASKKGIPDERREQFVDGIKKAVKAGYSELLEGKSALDSVQAAIRSMENNTIFDAGHGSVLTADKTVEMDAVIMCGKTLEAGAIACVQNIQNPIDLARKVKDEGTHVLLVGEGANKFAEDMGIKKVPLDKLITAEAIEEYERLKSEGYGASVQDGFGAREEQQPSGHDTVGAVAIDKDGNLAYGTSTGGITFKRPGRVGDSPIVGAGGYVDNEVGGVSCTGHGESFMKVCLAYQVIGHMKNGLSPEEAAKNALEYMGNKVNGYGGVIVLNNKGNIGKAFTTDRMVWAWAKNGKLHYGVDPDEDNEEDIRN